MASQKNIDMWSNQAAKLNSNPEYINAYVYFKEKAKVADQRLVALEALSHEKHFKGVKEYSYATAINDIQSWGGNRRFNIKPPKKLSQLNAMIADVEKFLGKKTSKKSEILKIYKKRADSISNGYTDKYGVYHEGYAKRYGVEFTWQDIANYYEKEKGRITDIAKGSKTEVRALAVIKKIHDSEDMQILERINDKDIQSIIKKGETNPNKLTKKEQETLDAIKDAKDNILRVSGNDKIMEKVVTKLIEQGRTYETLMGGN